MIIFFLTSNFVSHVHFVVGNLNMLGFVWSGHVLLAICVYIYTGDLPSTILSLFSLHYNSFAVSRWDLYLTQLNNFWKSKI